ncbi:MAG: fatty acid desaturase [Planctomycetes bacterium]|nr:fatty acid desaturase [Planctomycetota bacterium]
MSQAKPERRQIIWLNTIFLTVTPVLAIASTIYYGVEYGITWRELVAGLVIWSFTGMGITAGYHRLFAHKGYKAHKSVRFALAVCGAAAIENSAIAWCSDHRHHHAETDTDGDPYNAKRGFWYSHIGWIFFKGARGDAYDNVPDLRADPILAWQHRNYLAIAIGANVLFVVAAGLLLGNMLGMAIIAGLLRLVVVQHMTFLINSVAHIFGKQPWSKATTSRDNWFLSLFTFGEGYHNYHHSFQADYRNGPRWYNWDPTKWLIWSLDRVGLASHLRRSPADLTLKARFETSRDELQPRALARMGETAEEWSLLLQEKREQLKDQKEQLMVSLREGKEALCDRFLSAEAQVEHYLQELKALRVDLKERVGMSSTGTSDSERQQHKREAERLRQAMRQTHAKAKETLARWEALALECVSAAPGPQPVTA